MDEHIAEQRLSDKDRAAESFSSSWVSLLSTLTKWRRFILISVLSGTIIAAAVAFLLTPKFEATTSVFPAERAELFGALEGVSSLMKSFSAKSLANLGTNPELDRYMAILKSGRVLNAVIQKFDLVHVYDITSYPGEKTVKELLENVEFTAETEGYVTIVVYDADPQRAADMANFFVEMLNTVNTELLIVNARGNRQFIGNRYDKNLHDLAAAEDSLKSFQKRYGVIAMPQQTEEALKAGAQLWAQLALREVQLEIQKRTQSIDNPAVAAAQIEVDELRKKINQMNNGKGVAKGQTNIFVPFASIPDLGADYIRRFREVEVQYKILQILTPLYEQAKIEEQRQTPSVLVLDKGYPAERKSKPKRAFIALGGFVVSLVFSLCFAALADRWNGAREAQSPVYVMIDRLTTALKSDWRALRKRRSANTKA
jgi:tyrosine-protein kinase Etk/Wzc